MGRVTGALSETVVFAWLRKSGSELSRQLLSMLSRRVWPDLREFSVPV